MPTRPGECDRATIEQNRGQVRPEKLYADVRNVLIRASDPATRRVTISAVGTDGARHDYPDLVWGDEDVMWVYCPSSLPSQAIYPDPGPVPAVGATGTLYLERAFLASATPKIGGTPKWPLALPGETRRAELSIAPTRLLLTGTELANNGHVVEETVDLMDRTLAPEQTIAIGDGAIKVQLTPKGFRKFRAIFPVHIHLAEAVRTIQEPAKERKDPARIAEAWEIVAVSKELVETGKWPEPDPHRSGDLKLADARRLLAEVIDMP